MAFFFSFVVWLGLVMEVKVSVDQPIQGRIGQFNGWEDPCQSIRESN